MTIERALIATLWRGMPAAVTRIAAALLVPFPTASWLAPRPAGAAVTGRTGLSITQKSLVPGLAARLCQAGARQVLRVGLTGCLPAKG